jgi:hypothetical protein
MTYRMQLVRRDALGNLEPVGEPFEGAAVVAFMNDADLGGIAGVGPVDGFPGYPLLMMVAIDSFDAKGIAEYLVNFDPLREFPFVPRRSRAIYERA